MLFRDAGASRLLVTQRYAHLWQAEGKWNATAYTSDADNPTNAVGGPFILGLHGRAAASRLPPTQLVDRSYSTY